MAKPHKLNELKKALYVLFFGAELVQSSVFMFKKPDNLILLSKFEITILITLLLNWLRLHQYGQF